MAEDLKIVEKKVIPKKIRPTPSDSKFKTKNQELLKEGKFVGRMNGKFAGYQGSTPFIEVDMDWQQMPLDRTTVNIPRENLTRMFPLAYLAGKLSALDNPQKASFAMIVLALIVIASVGINFFMSSGTADQLKQSNLETGQRFNNITQQLDDQNTVLMMIAVKSGVDITQIMNITGNPVPTIGG